jgi:co-chaperonin GroES (HSP10)
MKIKPLGDRVLIKRTNKKNTEKKLSSGIYLAEEKKDDIKNRGLIEAIGPKLQEKEKEGKLHFKVGDTVLFSWGESIESDGETYDLVSESSVLAVLED